MKKAILVLAVLVGLGATPSSAGDWTLRLAGAWVDTNAGFDIVEPEEEIFGAIRVGGAPGLALSIERRVGPHLGLKIAATVTSLPATENSLLRALPSARKRRSSADPVPNMWSRPIVASHPDVNQLPLVFPPDYRKNNIIADEDRILMH